MNILKVEGRAFHFIPASGYINHGYYSLSPSVLQDFYERNGCVVDKLDIILIKRGLLGQPASLMDSLSTEPDYRVWNMMDGETAPDYLGMLRCIATKKTASMTENPKQTQWYGMIHGDWMQEVWGVDFDLEQRDTHIGIYGTGQNAQTFLRVLKEHPAFEQQKIKAFLVDGDIPEGQSLEGYPIHSIDGIASEDISAIFLSSNENHIYERLASRMHGVKIIRLSDYTPILRSR